MRKGNVFIGVCKSFCSQGGGGLRGLGYLVQGHIPADGVESGGVGYL